MQSLSFIQISERGLFPHDLIRDVITADLRWRNARWYGTLHQRARSYYLAQLEAAQQHNEQMAILYDLTFLHRDNLVVRQFFTWPEQETTAMTLLRESDKTALIAMVAQYEGAESATIATYWLNHQPEGTRVFRGADNEPLGFLQGIALHQIGDTDREIDAGVQVAWAYLQNVVQWRPGERTLMFRFWMARDTYQEMSTIQSAIFVSAMQQYVSLGGLAYTFFCCADPDFWQPLFAYADLYRLSEVDFEMGGHHYGTYGHDWRLVTPAVWLDLLAQRELLRDMPLTIAPVVHPVDPLIVLDQAAFETAVQQGLRDLFDPHKLRRNPLLLSRLVIQRAEPGAGESQLMATLQTLLQEAAATLQSIPREEKLYRAIHHTYFQPADTQEQVAELLDLPFSTYRRYLKTGILRIAERLWQQEIEG